MPNPLVKRAKQNTIQKVYVYARVTCPFACDRCKTQQSLWVCHKRIFFQPSDCPECSMAQTQTALTIQEWVATNLEFTLQKN